MSKSVRERASAAFINRNFTLFMIGSFVAATGSWSQAVALGWLVLELGNSTFLLGLAGFAQMIPLLVLSYPAGALADRVDRRMMMILSQCGSLLASVVLMASAVLGIVTIPLILAASLALGVFNALSWPVWTVFIKDIVGAKHLRHAVALNAARFNLTRVIGPALAGWMLAQFGAATCLVVSTACIAPMIVSIIAIRLAPAPKREPEQWLSALKLGVSYAWRTPHVRELLITAGVIGILVMPSQSFLPAFARDILRAGPQGYGWLLAAIGAGAVVGAFATGHPLISRSPRRALAVFALISGLCLAVFAQSTSLWLSLATSAGVGFASIGFMVVANATLQLSVRDDLIGRIMGLYTVVNAGVMPVGSLVQGALSEQITLATTLMAAGIAAAALGLLLARQVARGGIAATAYSQPTGQAGS
jgi:MFS family permease